MAKKLFMAKKKTGKVYLVGAGPGHPGLLTLKAVECLAAADVVLHDRLIPMDVLQHYAPYAKLKYVGKKASFHTLPQDEIEDLLVKEARRGNIVVRLKGGDPYILGRGGEEAERLFDEDIDFEVVPGISSAFAVPLYGGIPLTHRRFTPEIAIVTGHENRSKPGDMPYHAGQERAASSWIHWPTLAKMGTIVFLMGVGNVRANMAKLIEHGLDPNTPAAIVRWGGLGKQRSLKATVATLADAIKREEFKAPAVIVVGHVVSLSDKLNFFARKRFFGQNFLITRAHQDNAELKKPLLDDGACVLDCPGFEYRALRPSKEELARIQNIQRWDWLIFTSPRGVKYFLSCYRKIHADVRALAHIKIAAVGEKTASVLRAENLWVDLEPRVASAAGLAKEKIFAHTKKKRILVVQAKDSRRELMEALALSHRVETLTLYRKIFLHFTKEVRAAILKERIDWVLFYSPSAVDAFLRGVGLQAGRKVLGQSHVAAIGPTTERALKLIGVDCTVVARHADTGELLNRISAQMSKRACQK